jgi:hypothetical protein
MGDARGVIEELWVQGKVEGRLFFLDMMITLL